MAVSGLSQALSAWEAVTEPYLDLLNQYYTDQSEMRSEGISSEKETAGAYVEWILVSAEAEQERAKACLSADVAVKAVKAVQSCASSGIIPQGTIQDHRMCTGCKLTRSAGRRNELGRRRGARPSVYLFARHAIIPQICIVFARPYLCRSPNTPFLTIRTAFEPSLPTRLMIRA